MLAGKSSTMYLNNNAVVLWLHQLISNNIILVLFHLCKDIQPFHMDLLTWFAIMIFIGDRTIADQGSIWDLLPRGPRPFQCQIRHLWFTASPSHPNKRITVKNDIIILPALNSRHNHPPGAAQSLFVCVYIDLITRPSSRCQYLPMMLELQNSNVRLVYALHTHTQSPGVSRWTYNFIIALHSVLSAYLPSPQSLDGKSPTENTWYNLYGPLNDFRCLSPSFEDILFFS